MRALETLVFNIKFSAPEVDQAAALLTAMANPKRLVILMLLSRDEIAVGVLADAVGLSQSALSQHLAKLRQGNLVTTRRDAQTVYYSSRSTAVARMLLALEKIYAPTPSPETSD